MNSIEIEDDREPVCESSCETHGSDTANEFIMQTEIGMACDDTSSYEAISFDCQASGDFDYEQAAIQSTRNATLKASVTTAEEYDPEPAQLAICGTPSSHELFGDFDEEEPVSDKPQRPMLHVGDTGNTFDDRNANRNDGEDLEASLHREILSLRSATSGPVLWMEDGDGEDPVYDDRDMLVIEDDVNVESAVIVNEAHDERDGGTSVAIDFHAMLAKMRTTKR